MESPVFDEQIMSAQSVLNTPSTIIGPGVLARAREISFYIVFGAGVNAGVVKIESAHDPTYPGTWAVEATVTFAAATSVQHVAITGVHKALRARISTAIGVGTVDVHAVAN